jgi:GR25 family glycosyltransferase involved in LPS biosynthesis
MDFFYLNLDSARRRREEITLSFSQNATMANNLIRIRATEPTDLKEIKNPRVRPTERAVANSHIVALNKIKEKTEKCAVLEDDTIFSRTLFKFIKNAQCDAMLDKFDIIFTDIIATHPNFMTQLCRIRKERNRKINLINLSGKIFAGASSYILTPATANKILKLIGDKQDQAPFDIALRSLINSNQITAAVTFPFLTTVSRESFNSSNQPHGTEFTDYIWNTFRRSVWIDRDAEEAISECTKIKQVDWDADMEILSILSSAHALPAFKPK